MKTCSKCLSTRPSDQFNKRKANKDGLTVWCKPCVSTYNKIRKANYSPERVEQLKQMERAYRQSKPYKDYDWSRHIAKKFGISEFQYNEMQIAQKNCCQICSINQKDSKRRFAIDHNHSTGKIRGLLCQTCNQAIGMLKENKDILYSAIKYLEKYENR